MALSPMGNRSCCVMRTNNDCEGDYSKCGTVVFYFCSEVIILDNRDNRPQNTCVSVDKLCFYLSVDLK